MVKFLSLFGAIYFLGLTLVPCSDFDSHSEVNFTENHDIDGSHEHDHENSSDDCSPLCFCQCCHINIVLNNSTPLKDIILSENKSQTFYLGNIPESNEEILLRPPRA